MAGQITLPDLAFQRSGRFLTWATQEAGTGSANGTPTVDVSGIDVSGTQVCKVAVTPNSGATLSFRLWLQYDGEAAFYEVDGSSRTSISTGWTQEVNTGGVARIYVEVTSIDTGTFDVKIAKGVQGSDQDAFTAGEALNQGDAVYLDFTDTKIYRASVQDTVGFSDRMFLGIALDGAVLDEEIQVRYRGPVNVTHSFTQGDFVYLSESTAGALTTTPVSGRRNAPVGYVSSDNQIDLLADSPEDDSTATQVTGFGTFGLTRNQFLDSGLLYAWRPEGRLVRPTSSGTPFTLDTAGWTDGDPVYEMRDVSRRAFGPIPGTTPEWDTGASQYSQAVRFVAANSDYLQWPSGSEGAFNSIHDAGVFTIVVRILFFSDPTTTNQIILRNNGAERGFGLLTSAGGGEDLRFHIKNGTNTIVTDVILEPWTGANTTDIFTIAVTGDGSTVRMFIDDFQNQVASDTFTSGGSGNAQGPLHLGRANHLASGFMDASVLGLWLSEKHSSASDLTDIENWMTEVQ